MNILQATFGIFRHFQAEHLLELLVPVSGNVADFELAFDEFHLDFEAQDNVQIISDLVGFDADKRRRDTIDRSGEL